jgi:prevent-host-death family protein
MNVAGIKDVKNNLSRYLAKVKQGEEVLITEWGKPIARIIKESEGNTSIRCALSSLIQKGLISMPSQSINRGNPPRIKSSGKTASEMAIEDRR